MRVPDPEHLEVGGARFELLLNVLLSLDYAFLLVATEPDAAGGQQWLLRYFALRGADALRVRSIGATQSAQPLNLHAASDNGLL